MTQTKEQKPILVTGATGRQGGTGFAVAQELLARGFSVRALVRTLDERAEAVQALGAAVVVGDFANFASLLAALDGVESAYFCYPVADGIADAAGLFAGAGRQRGLRRIVDMSLASSRPEHPSPQARAQWVAEQIFEWAGFEGEHLRVAAFFMENVLAADKTGIRDRSRIANPFGDLRLPWIAGRDAGAVAASLLANPALVPDRTITIGGAERLSYREATARISEAIGREVRYEELTPEQWRSELLAENAANVRGVDHLVAQSVALKRIPALPVTDHVQQFTGRAPIVFADFVASVRQRLV